MVQRRSAWPSREVAAQISPGHEPWVGRGPLTLSLSPSAGERVPAGAGEGLHPRADALGYDISALAGLPNSHPGQI